MKQKTKAKKSEKKEKKEIVRATFQNERVITEDSDAARELYNQGGFGVILENNKLQLSLYEALYLMERGKVSVFDLRNKKFTLERFLKWTKKTEPSFWTKYCVFKDIRNRGYIIKTALKFGADFRVYDRGIKPGEDHARWIVYPVQEGSVLTWYEFAAKNRVAHSTKKRLLIAIVDEENSTTFYEVKWTRP